MEVKLEDDETDIKEDLESPNFNYSSTSAMAPPRRIIMRGKQWEASGKRREETEGARVPPAASTERNRRRTELARLRQALEPRPYLNAAGPSGLLRPKVEPAESPAAPIENIQDYLDVGETLISVPSRPPASVFTDIKTDMMVEIELEPVPLKNESAELLLEVKREHKEDELGVKEEDSQEFKYSNTQDDYLDIEETVISKPRGAPASISTDNKCGPDRRKNKSREKSDMRQLVATKQVLKKKRKISTEKPYKCEACDYRCKVTSSLKRHMRTHTGEKPFRCNVCEYRCTQESTLKQHFRIHTGEKPYKCETCDYRCSVSSSLKKHIRIHTGEKPYKCDTCDYRCTVNSKLKQHMRTHN